jgi:hypothetical protein
VFLKAGGSMDQDVDSDCLSDLERAVAFAILGVKTDHFKAQYTDVDYMNLKELEIVLTSPLMLDMKISYKLVSLEPIKVKKIKVNLAGHRKSEVIRLECSKLIALIRRLIAQKDELGYFPNNEFYLRLSSSQCISE